MDNVYQYCIAITMLSTLITLVMQPYSFARQTYVMLNGMNLDQTAAKRAMSFTWRWRIELTLLVNGLATLFITSFGETTAIALTAVFVLFHAYNEYHYEQKLRSTIKQSGKVFQKKEYLQLITK